MFAATTGIGVASNVILMHAMTTAALCDLYDAHVNPQGAKLLDLLDEEHLGERATEMGEYLRSSLRISLADCEVVREVRGLGLMNGIEFQAPARLDLRLYFETFQKIHPAAF
jgi:adenosylmethionine-8-amino-7-oxononanoate aminotransferase